MNESDIQKKIESVVDLGVQYMSNAYGGVTGLHWVTKVNLSTLHMSDNRLCVLGQVAGNFASSPLAMTVGFHGAARWGFYLTADDLDEGITYAALTDEWKRRITELKKRRAVMLYRYETAGVTDSWRED